MPFEPVDSKPNWSELQQSMIDYWKEKKLFERSVDERPEEKPYRFYDGPPFITGTPHYGSLLSSIIKDVVPRYQTMKGKRVERVWGWDCHGLPIEQKVQAKLGLESNKEIEAAGIGKFIDECYKYTENTSAEWGWYIDQIGRWVDFENAYKTMDQDYMESVLWVFKQLYDKDLVYEGKRVSWYSWKLSTPISNFEIAMDDSYVEVQDRAVTVKFRLNDGLAWEEGDVFLLAWTTTPWTVPANMAIAVNKDLTYVMVRHEGTVYVVAKNRAETVFKGRGEYEVIQEMSGEKLVGLSYSPPFKYYVGKVDETKNHRVYHADFVTDEDGTGIAHEAPEFGDVDFELAQANGVHITEAIDNEGKYTAEVPDYEGKLFLDMIEPITDRLATENRLFKKETITHRVPECPRSKTLLMQKAQKSWFIDIQGLKPKLFEKNKDINWFPEYFKDGRFRKSIESAPDWCISRTRYWGTPMPIWLGRDASNKVVDIKVFGSIEEIQNASGMEVENLHRPYIDEVTWIEDEVTYERIPEVFDCWVESGSMPWAQDHYPFENKNKMEASFPADFIAEYTGQIRAWFYVMHVLAVALEDNPSFKNVVVTGVINGTDGRKMSKSYGNYPDPKETILQYGSDAIRFYLMNSPLMRGEDMNFSEEGIQEVLKKVMLPLWNAYSFFATYANIDGWMNNEQGTMSNEQRNELDVWILSQLQQLVQNVTTNMDTYDMQKACEPFVKFFDNLNNWYIRRNRRRFWKGEMDTDKQAGYETLYTVLTTVCELLAPVCPFISDYLYQRLTGEETVHLKEYPKGNTDDIQSDVDDRVASVQRVVSLGLAYRSKQGFRVRQPLSTVYVVSDFDDDQIQVIQEELNVKSVEKIGNIDEYASVSYAPDARKIGQTERKRFMKDILTKAKAGDVTMDGEDLVLDLDGVEIRLGSDEFEVRYIPKDGTDISFEAGFGTVVGMDDKLTEDLILEGYARDIIRGLQEARKEAGFEVTDRIEFELQGDKDLEEAVKKHRELIEGEVLGLYVESVSGADHHRSIEIEEKETQISVKRV